MRFRATRVEVIDGGTDDLVLIVRVTRVDVTDGVWREDITENQTKKGEKNQEEMGQKAEERDEASQ